METSKIHPYGINVSGAFSAHSVKSCQSSCQWVALEIIHHNFRGNLLISSQSIKKRSPHSGRRSGNGWWMFILLIGRCGMLRMMCSLWWTLPHDPAECGAKTKTQRLEERKHSVDLWGVWCCLQFFGSLGYSGYSLVTQHGNGNPPVCRGVFLVHRRRLFIAMSTRGSWYPLVI